MKRRRQMTTTMTTKTRRRTKIRHDEPRSTPAMWTPKNLPVGGSCKLRANSASPSADCQGHYRVPPEPARGYAFLSTRVLPHHPPLPGVAGTHTSRLAAIPELQILRDSFTLPHNDKDPRRRKDRDPAKTRWLRPCGLLVTSTPCTWVRFRIRVLRRWPYHSKVRDGMLFILEMRLGRVLLHLHSERLTTTIMIMSSVYGRST